MAELVEIIGTLYEMEVLKWMTIKSNFFLGPTRTGKDFQGNDTMRKYKTLLLTFFPTLVSNIFHIWAKFHKICLNMNISFIENVLVTQHGVKYVIGQGVNKEFASTRAEKIFEQLDEDGNGELSEEEFCRWNGDEGGPEGFIAIHSSS